MLPNVNIVISIDGVTGWNSCNNKGLKKLIINVQQGWKPIIKQRNHMVSMK